MNSNVLSVFIALVPWGGSFWIGLTDQENEGVWLWSYSRSAPQNPQWLDGRPDGGTAENCAMLFTGSLDDNSCETMTTHVKPLCTLFVKSKRQPGATRIKENVGVPDSLHH